MDQARQTIAQSKVAAQATWFAEETSLRRFSIERTVRDYAPWFSPEFASLRDDPALNLKLMDSIALEQLPEFIDKLIIQLDWMVHSASQEQRPLYERFLDRLKAARANTTRLIADLRAIAKQSGELADEMDFKFLLNKHRRLVSVGFDVDKRELNSACYDLLGTESRTAVFAAIAKEHIPQESWFLLGPCPYPRWRSTGSALMDRYLVRIPHAVALDAFLFQYAAGAHVYSMRTFATGLCDTEKCSLGYLRIGLLQTR